jgi:S-DNA-T family DNA segregation ATPase FtsK/SpoIIIE
MHRILGVCQDCGLLWHEERVTYRNGQTELRRVDDILPTDTVLVTPHYEKYGLRVNPRMLPRLRSMASQFAYALNVPHAAVEVDGDVVYVRVPRPEGEGTGMVTFESAWAIAPDVPCGSVLLGIDEDRHQLVLDLTSPSNVHAAVIGMTGSGKSTLMRTMILSAEMIGGAKVALFDPSDGFHPLSGHPSVWRGGLFKSAEDCERGLEALASSIGRGMAGLTFVFVDEVPELIMRCPAIRDYLARLAQAGRHAGVHLILGAQHPLASELGPMTMRNIPVRLVGRVADRSAAYNATGRSDTNAESLRGKGDFIVVNGSSRQHFQAAYASPKLLAEWARRYPPREPRLPPRPTQVEAPQRERSFAPSFGGGPGGLGGRPMDDIPESVVREIQHYIGEHGRPPSSNWVYRMTKQALPTGGFNRDKVRRALLAAGVAAAQLTVPARVGRLERAPRADGER